MVFSPGKEEWRLSHLRGRNGKDQSVWDDKEQWSYQPVIENTELGSMLLLFDPETQKPVFRGEFNPLSKERHGWGCT